MGATLEEALTALDERLAGVAKTAKATLSALKKAQANAGVGQVRDLARNLTEARSAAQRFAAEMAQADSSWSFDVEHYLGDGGYLKELLHSAHAARLNLFERDGRIYCFPMLLRLSAKDSAVMVDRKAERRLRPRSLVEVLLKRQQRPQRFNEQKLLDTLFAAYCRLGARWLRDWTRESRGAGPVVPLLELYELMTLLPDAEREYPKEEFARDIYLLDLHPDLATKDGHGFELSGATLGKNAGLRLTMVDREGGEKVYVGIRFKKD